MASLHSTTQRFYAGIGSRQDSARDCQGLPGTARAIKLAQSKEIPVVNLGDPAQGVRSRPLLGLCSGILI